MTASSRGWSSSSSQEMSSSNVLHQSIVADAGPSRLGLDTPATSSLSSGTSGITAHNARSSPSSSSSSSSAIPVSFFPTSALDHAFAGITAGAIATVCMNPLDLIKTKFQVDTSASYHHDPSSKGKGPAGVGAGGIAARESMISAIRRGKVVTDIYGALRDIVVRDGWAGLYRGLSPNIVGNSASWGLYFLWYTMIKEHMSLSQDGSDRNRKLTATQHLLAASESGAVTALMTNPIWVVKTRMFTAPRSTPAYTASHTNSQRASVVTSTSSGNTTVNPYRTLRSSLLHIYRTEGIRGLWKGGGLALFGVSNGAIQFMAYEQLKRYRSDSVIKQRGGVAALRSDEVGSGGQVKLSNGEYVVISASAKLLAIFATYPYQVIRSRVQNHSSTIPVSSQAMTVGTGGVVQEVGAAAATVAATPPPPPPRYPSVRSCIAQTWKGEGARGFYKGLGTSLVRIIPATCVTFVVYENLSWALQTAATDGRKEKREKGRLR